MSEISTTFVADTYEKNYDCIQFAKYIQFYPPRANGYKILNISVFAVADTQSDLTLL